MDIKNITNPIRKIEKYLGSRITENNVEIVDDVIEVWNVDGKTMPTAEQLNSFDAEVLADIQAEADAITEKENLKASAKAKLIAGEALTEDEANTIVL
jgi:hypothetical protein